MNVVTVRMSRRLHFALLGMARRTGKSLNKICLSALEDEFLHNVGTAVKMNPLRLIAQREGYTTARQWLREQMDLERDEMAKYVAKFERADYSNDYEKLINLCRNLSKPLRRMQAAIGGAEAGPDRSMVAGRIEGSEGNPPTAGEVGSRTQGAIEEGS